MGGKYSNSHITKNKFAANNLNEWGFIVNSFTTFAVKFNLFT